MWRLTEFKLIFHFQGHHREEASWQGIWPLVGSRWKKHGSAFL